MIRVYSWSWTRSGQGQHTQGACSRIQQPALRKKRRLASTEQCCVAILRQWPLVLETGEGVKRSKGVIGDLPWKILQHWIISALHNLPLTENKFKYSNRPAYESSEIPSMCLVHRRWTDSNFIRSSMKPELHTGEAYSSIGRMWALKIVNIKSADLHTVDFNRFVETPPALRTTWSSWGGNCNWASMTTPKSRKVSTNLMGTPSSW